MNLAVKFYSNMLPTDENVLAGISLKIPAEVVFNIDTAPDDTYEVMTEEEYSAHLNSIKPELDAWKIIQNETAAEA